MSQNEPSLRPFRASDAEAAVDIAARVGLSPWSVADYRSEPERNDSIMFAVDVGSSLIGFIIGRQVTGPGDAPEAEILNIGVDPTHQRRGLGRALIKAFLDECRGSGVERVWLEVRTSNTPAIEFYKSFGFNEYTVRPSLYANPTEDGIVMTLALAEFG